ncbi:MAG: hypothetical protein Q9201_007760 [Fulgogasparrea decipioides]
MSETEDFDAPAVMSPTVSGQIGNPDVPIASTPGASGPIVLQVGEQRFYGSKDILSGSEMLKAKTNEHWLSGKQTDGSYFLDADPAVVKHILRFLRHGVYPLCYDIAKGHDFALYAAIHRQADFLLIEKLTSWLGDQQYFKAVTVERSARSWRTTRGLLGFLVRAIRTPSSSISLPGGLKGSMFVHAVSRSTTTIIGAVD